MIRSKESGQALVLVLLSLSVVLTLVLYILSRSVTDVAVSSRQEESVRAFSAAEAGIERSLITGVDYNNPVGIGNASYTTTITNVAAGSKEYAFPNPISKGDTATVWFVSHDENGNLVCDATPDHPCFTGTEIQVCWGNWGTSANVAPAIELSVYYRNNAGSPFPIGIGRVAVDPSFIRQNQNSFSSPNNIGTCQIGDQRYQFYKRVTFASLGITSNNTPNGLQFAQVKMFYNDTPHIAGVILFGNGFLPSQGRQIDSTGVSGDGSQGVAVNRRVIVSQGWPEFPFASNSLITPFGVAPE